MSLKTSLLSASSALALALINQVPAVQAADIINEPLCAVSGFNGKVEALGGYSENDDQGGDALVSGLGSLSMPLGCDFGFQADVGVIDELDRTTYGGAAHLFTRDPESYLLGVTGGYFDAGDTNIWAVGPEAELYFGQFSLEAWGGYVDIDSDDGSDSDGFGIVDAAFYATDDFRLSVGGSIIGDQEFLRAGMEFQFADGLTASFGAKIGEDDYYNVTGGLSFYFGGGEKSLIRRHREDDPRNRILDFVGFKEAKETKGSSDSNTGTAPPTTVGTPPPTTQPN
ncbi:hypothetical protein G5V57_10880 [Nordella sp. HKS 07]|uniref:hypothetical protein n=1 Tax=Nordella sp. HKS 07 TaxID=2712222 RepID=UPI0013E0F51B|nr:hypothetical protein [Nordella sp. HKS 07]QIG48184.1 hypothetical protein G5V57_10880 [Nordella sp. HKS 07]